jgi:hypothetical protein
MQQYNLPKPKPYNPNLTVQNTYGNNMHTPNQLPDPFNTHNILDNNIISDTINNGYRKITLGSCGEYEHWNSSTDIIVNFDTLVKQPNNTTKQNSRSLPKISKEDEILLNNFIKSHSNSIEEI